jgi:hypothetical protein
LHAGAPQVHLRAGVVERRPEVAERHTGAAIGEQQRRGDAASRRADDRHVL